MVPVSLQTSKGEESESHWTASHWLLVLFPTPFLLVDSLKTWPNVSALVFRFWSLPWTNWPNIKLKWKLRYRPIHCAYLEPSSKPFSGHQCTKIAPRMSQDRKSTGSCWCLHWFLSLWADIWKKGVKIISLLGFTDWISFSSYLAHSGRSYFCDQVSFLYKVAFTIRAMNAVASF